MLVPIPIYFVLLKFRFSKNTLHTIICLLNETVTCVNHFKVRNTKLWYNYIYRKTNCRFKLNM